jgi:predicted pyridoxine 5'-phosphate oxidase superfamily flavin-nucleotide-binding protein
MRERLLAPNFWHLATADADGRPQVSPMWADIEDEYVMANTSIGRVKIDNLRLNPNVSLSHIDANFRDRAGVPCRQERGSTGHGGRRDGR